MKSQCVIGLDGGGTTTRALVADSSGHVLGYAEAGGANPNHNADAEREVQAAIQAVLAASGCQPAQIAGLVAGLAGLDEPADMEWANRFLAIPELHCPRTAINDTSIAHTAAFGGAPGVIAIAGTGSAIYAVTDTGLPIHNDDAHHYAGGARHLAYDAMHHILAGEATTADAGFITAVQEHWGANSIAELQTIVFGQRQIDPRSIKRDYGAMSMLVTSAAAYSPIACAACDRAAYGLTTGIRILGGCFNLPHVSVALIGSLARCAAIQTRIATNLAHSRNTHYQLHDPLLPPVGGAVIQALQQLGVPITIQVIDRLRSSIPIY
jgi:glucosamine kinase